MHPVVGTGSSKVEKRHLAFDVTTPRLEVVGDLGPGGISSRGLLLTIANVYRDLLL